MGVDGVGGVRASIHIVHSNNGRFYVKRFSIFCAESNKHTTVKKTQNSTIFGSTSPFDSNSARFFRFSNFEDNSFVNCLTLGDIGVIISSLLLSSVFASIGSGLSVFSSTMGFVDSIDLYAFDKKYTRKIFKYYIITNNVDVNQYT